MVSRSRLHVETSRSQLWCHCVSIALSLRTTAFERFVFRCSKSTQRPKELLLRSSHFLGVSLASINSVYSCNVPYFIKTNKYNVFIIYLIVIKFRILVCKERLVQSARIARREREVKIISTSWTLGGYSCSESAVNRQVELCGNAITPLVLYNLWLQVGTLHICMF